MNDTNRHSPPPRSGLLRDEGGFAMVAVMLVMAMVTALSTTAMLRARMDVAVAGNYKAQRSGEVTSDSGLQLAQAMIFNNSETIDLPLGIPATKTLAEAWPTNADGTVRAPVSYKSDDLDLSITIKYKMEDSINYWTGAGYLPPVTTRPANRADYVVRYGQDYNYADAVRAIGTQPVYTLTVADNKTGIMSKADVLGARGFRTPAAIFVKGKVLMTKHGNACQEKIEVTAGICRPADAAAGLCTIPPTPTPALATTKAKGADVFIQTVWKLKNSSSDSTWVTTPNRTGLRPHTDSGHVATPEAGSPWGNLTSCYTHFAYMAQDGVLAYYDRPSQYYANTVSSGSAHTSHASPLIPPSVASVANKGVAPFYNFVSGEPTTAPTANVDVYTDQELKDLYDAGSRTLARQRQFILLGIGNKDDGLDDGDPNVASAADAKAIFNFDKDDTNVVRYDYVMPGDGKLETMMGATFADFLSLADVRYVDANYGTEKVPDDYGGSTTAGRSVDLSDVVLGTGAVNPLTGRMDTQVVYFQSNMNNLTGAYDGTTALSMVTQSGKQMRGAGILVIDGDVNVYGSINWRGLMIVRGNLKFRPWQGGDWCNRSDNSLASDWNGYIMVGGDLNLLTLAGGTIILGYGAAGSSEAEIRGIISSAIERKTLSWRRSYGTND